METKNCSEAGGHSEAVAAVPRHVGILADGNRRWGRQNADDAAVGHIAGLENLLPVIDTAAQAGVERVTLMVFSTETWNRTNEEVGALMSLFAYAAKTIAIEARTKGIHVKLLGRREELPEELRLAIEEVETLTLSCDRIELSVGINYGGQTEIVDAARRMVRDGLSPEEITNETFIRYLYDPEWPEVDLVIRSGGELRLSNFMLWQTSYSEFYFTDTLWPDFSPQDLLEALEEYGKRTPRRGR